VRRAALVAAAAALLFAAGDGAALGLPGAPALAFPTASAGFAAGGGGILATTDGGRSWHLETRSPVAALSVVDSRTGWAISGRALLRTRDGRTWARIGRPALARIDFVDRRHGFALDRAGRLRRSAEAGRNWRVVRAPARLQALCFVSPRTGWVARGGSVWRTVNAGASWHRWTLVPVQGGAPVPELGCHGHDVYALFHEGGAAGSEGYVVFRSVDTGGSWRPVLANLDQRFGRLRAIDAYSGPFSVLGAGKAVFVGACPACGRQPTVTILRTLDHGRTWQRSVPLDGYFPEAVAFVDQRRGYLLTTPAHGAHAGGWIWATRDGGRHWHVVERSPALVP